MSIPFRRQSISCCHQEFSQRVELGQQIHNFGFLKLGLNPTTTITVARMHRTENRLRRFEFANQGAELGKN